MTVKSVKDDPDDENVITVTASATKKDRDGDIIEQEGWIIDNYMKNPVVLYAHDLRDLPIGKTIALEVKKTIMKAKIRFAAEIYERARLVRDLFKHGYLNAVSVGFLPIEKEEITPESKNSLHPSYRYKKQELLEISACPVPSLPDALQDRKDNELALVLQKMIDAMKGSENKMSEEIKKEEIEENIEEKKVSGATNLPLVMDRAWSAREAEMRVRKWASSDGSGSPDKVKMSKYAKAHFWYDGKAPDPDGDGYPDRLGDYKLPFADIVDGKLVAIWNGVTAAMKVLFGARGGVQIPAEEKKAVYNRIARYYKKAGKQPPEFRYVEAFVTKQEYDLEKFLEGNVEPVRIELHTETKDEDLNGVKWAQTTEPVKDEQEISSEDVLNIFKEAVSSALSDVKKAIKEKSE